MKTCQDGSLSMECLSFSNGIWGIIADHAFFLVRVSYIIIGDNVG